MKKEGVVLFSLLVILSAFALISAQGTTSVNTEQTNTELPADFQDKITKAYQCLESRVAGHCSSLNRIDEIAFTILAAPNISVTTECKDALQSKMLSNYCWGSGSCNIRDTAIAVLALQALGINVENSTKWLMSKNMTATDLIWYLEQDSNEATTCKFSYGDREYLTNIGADKVIQTNAGPCLTRDATHSNFWYQVSRDCYDQDFFVSCTKSFIATLLYRQPSSQTLFVLSKTEFSQAAGTIPLKIQTKCFGLRSCEYEASLWATIALARAGYDTSSFSPYIISSSEIAENKRYLPNAFAYMITGFEDYGTALIQEQQLGSYWQAPSSPYNRYYDTSIALEALADSTHGNVNSAKAKLIFDQKRNGCWGTSSTGSIRETAMAIWALENRAPTYYVPYVAPSATCGDRLIQSSEQCDGLNLNNKTCATQGFDSGILSCTSSCIFNISQCTRESPPGVVCGDNQIESGEQCEPGVAIVNNSCRNLSSVWQTGTYSCVSSGSSRCTYNFSQCTPDVNITAYCNGVQIDEWEMCDHSNLRGKSCISEGFDLGVLGCASDCKRFDYSDCRERGEEGTTVGSGANCEEAGFTCEVLADCAVTNKLSDYICTNPSLSKACCKVASQEKTCPQEGGKVCDSTLECDSNQKRTSDTSKCCLGNCIAKKPSETITTTTEDTDTTIDQTSTTIDTTTGTGSYLWIWLLILGILILVGIIAYLKREQLRLWWFKRTGKSPVTSSGLPPRPGSAMPPRGPMPVMIRRPMPGAMAPRPMMQRPAAPQPQARPVMGGKTDKELENTFKRLKEMSK